MTDIFEAKIMCKNCNQEMQKGFVQKAGVNVRAVKCSGCEDVIVHPADLDRLKQYDGLKGKTYNVKLRVVGNSHAISIPKEIVNFMRDMQKTEKEMDDMVRLCFEDFRKLSLNFGGDNEIK